MGKSRRSAGLQAQLNLPEAKPSVSAGPVDLNPDVVSEIQAWGNDAMATAVEEAAANVPGAAGVTGAGGVPGGEGGPSKGEQAAAQVAQKAGSGAPMPSQVTQDMGGKLGGDFSGVRLHEGEGALNDMNAQALAYGNDVFFAPGQFAPGTAQGDGLIAEELTHVAQTGGATPSGDSLATSSPSDSSEREAGAVRSAVESGQDAPDVSGGSESADTMHLASAGVHQSIEMDALGVEGPGLVHDLNKDASALDPDQKSALELYSGNFMRDFSQLNAPTIVKGMRDIPTNPFRDDSPSIGAAGAKSLIDGVIKAFSIIELGPEAAKLVTPEATSQYEAQEHIDNPMGNTAADFTVVDSDNNYVEADNPSVTPKMIEKQLSGAAVEGKQFQNPNLYKASETGLMAHIYNSTEYSKGQFIEAAEHGQGAEGRSHMGAGLHLVEDYYSHTNVVEVMLNRYISDAIAQQKAGTGATDTTQGKGWLAAQMAEEGKTEQGYWVDTLFDQQVTGPDGQSRQVINSGSFGGLDTKMSIAHMLLPMLPKAEAALHGALDKVFGALDTTQKAGSWKDIIQAAGGDRASLALDAVVGAADEAGMKLPVPTDFELSWSELQISPGWFGDPWTVDVPSGVTTCEKAAGLEEGLGYYGGLYKKAKNIIDTIQKYTKWVGLGWLVDKVKALLDRALAGVRQRMKQMISQMLIKLVESVTGVNPQEEGHTELKDLVAVAEEKVAEAEAGTSLQSRMGKEGGDLYNATHGLDDKGKAIPENVKSEVKAKLESQLGKLKGKGTADDPWVPESPLPPSHTEINKDHGPKEVEGGDGSSVAEQGSLFYGPAEKLSIEADRHIMKQMAVVWGTDILGQGKTRDLSTNADTSVVDQQAASNAQDESQRATEAGHKYLQDDSAYVQQNPEVKKLLDYVDLFMGHPDAGNWWVPTVDAYVSGHAEEVHSHILARNKTRGARK